MVGRKRVLSEEGLKLFNVSMGENKEIVRNYGCLKSLVLNLLTSDFDIKLDNTSVQLRKASQKMYSYLSDNDKKYIPSLIDNAITNIILLILLDDGKINKLQKIKYNINYYVHLAKRAHLHGDHHTAILIKAALENGALRRLHMKSKKSEQKILKELEDSYGTFMDCNSQHLRTILSAKETDIENFLPSIMVILMHLNKTREYAKSYKSLGMVTDRLIKTQFQLQQIVNDYYVHYKNYSENLLELYLQNPLDNPVLNSMPSKSTACKLYDLSYKILPSNDKLNKNTFSSLKRTKPNRAIITHH